MANNKSGAKNNYGSQRRRGSSNKSDRSLKNESAQKGYLFGTNPGKLSEYINAKVAGTNDVAWYNKCGDLLEKSSQVNFTSVLGNPVPVTDEGVLDFGDNQFTVSESQYTIPGIMVFDTVTTPGHASDPNSPFNLAVTQMYENERSKLNKLNPNYEMPDLGILMCCFDDVYSQYMNIVRLFGLLNAYNADSKYTPFKLVEALYGINYNNIQAANKDKANLIARFNTLLRYARQFVYYPEDFALTTRHAWLFSSIFKDHATRKAQLYGFSKKNYYVWDEQTYDTGSTAVYHDFRPDDPQAPHADTVAKYLDIFEASLNALRSSTSINAIVSDLRNAYADRTMIGFADVTDDYTIIPDERDDHALMQIENMMPVLNWDGLVQNSKNISQNPDENLLVYRPYWDPTAQDSNFIPTMMNKVRHFYINLHSDDLGYGEVAEATRLVPTFDFNTDLIEGGVELKTGADVVTGIKIVTAPDGVTVPISDLIITSDVDISDVAGIVGGLTYYMAFDWAPRINYVYNFNGTHLSQANSVIEWDRYANIGVLNQSNTFLEQVNRVCMLSLWNVQGY